MKKNTSILVENISKKYVIGEERQSYLTIRDQILKIPQRLTQKLSKRKKDYSFWALKNINFEVKKGEVVGIIGRNGAGKSTLLKILSRIVEPTKGKIKMRGRVASLLEVGTGFHPELTGRENIFLNGAILGMKKKEIQTKLDQIVEFSGIKKFIDTPVKKYSSGMYVRLAFSVAAHLESDILLVDEILAVGDADFQKKCLGKMNDLSKSGRTVIFVSHNLGAVSRLCKKCIYLKDGRIVDYGETNKVINNYNHEVTKKSHKELIEIKSRGGLGNVKISGLEIFNKNEDRINNLKSGDKFSFEISYERLKSKKNIENIEFSISIFSNLSQFISRLNNLDSGTSFTHLPSKGRVRCSIKKLSLMPGIYKIYISIKINNILEDSIEVPSQLLVSSGNFFNTDEIVASSNKQGVYIDHGWEVSSKKNK